MYYSAIGLLAVLILLIENQDVMLNQEGAFEKPAWRVYRWFLFAVLAYYILDILWGIIEGMKLPRLLFADTTVYFIAMAVGVLFWVKYTVVYLDEESSFGKGLILAGRVLAGLITVLAVVNIFTPVLFTIDSRCVYSALPLRYIMLACQILLLLLIAIYAVASMFRSRCSSRFTPLRRCSAAEQRDGASTAPWPFSAFCCWCRACCPSTRWRQSPMSSLSCGRHWAWSISAPSFAATGTMSMSSVLSSGPSC